MWELFQIGGLRVERLGPEHADCLQRLWERCTDFHQLQEGAPTRPTAGREDLAALPHGKTAEDKLAIGLRSPEGELVGYLDLIRDFPEPGEWWIGLLLLDPAVRGHGLGTRVYRALAPWTARQGARSVGIGVLERNVAAERFWRALGFQHVRWEPYTSAGGVATRIRVMRHPFSPPTSGAR